MGCNADILAIVVAGDGPSAPEWRQNLNLNDNGRDYLPPCTRVSKGWNHSQGPLQFSSEVDLSWSLHVYIAGSSLQQCIAPYSSVLASVCACVGDESRISFDGGFMFYFFSAAYSISAVSSTKGTRCQSCHSNDKGIASLVNTPLTDCHPPWQRVIKSTYASVSD